MHRLVMHSISFNMLNIREITESRISWTSDKVGLIQMWVRDCQIHGSHGYEEEKGKNIYTLKNGTGKSTPKGTKTNQKWQNTTRDRCGSGKQDNEPQVVLNTAGRKLVLVGTQKATGELRVK